MEPQQSNAPKHNYQRDLDYIIRRLERTGEVPALLLHACCAPCSSYTIEYLSQYFKSKTRLKASAESGPGVLRTATSVTCLSAEEHCRQNDLALKIRSSWNVDREQLVFSGKVRARHTRDEGFGTPLYEAGIAYAQDAANSAGIAVTIPKGAPKREIQLRSSAEVGNDFLQLSLAVTFRRTADEELHPLHAAMRAKVMF